MDTITLEAKARDSAVSARKLRQQKTVPCVVYGNTKNMLVSCAAQDLLRAYAKAGESTVVDLKVDGKSVPVLFHMVDLDPVTDDFEHVDFYALDMTKKVTTHVPVHGEGDAPAVKGLGGVLVTVLSELTVTCLPKDLPHAFSVSLEKLAEFGATITVADITIPAGVEISEEPTRIIFTVQEPRAEVEETPAAPAEGEAAAEGAPAAEAAGEQAEKKDEKKDK